MGNILFLDDMEERHREFGRISIGHWVAHVFSAEDAIDILGKVKFDQVFLDHDLSREDIMIKVGEDGKVPTGMTVVDHIITMEDPPPDVIIHSCNGPARTEMHRRLEEKTQIRVRSIPFPELIHRIGSSVVV